MVLFEGRAIGPRLTEGFEHPAGIDRAKRRLTIVPRHFHALTVVDEVVEIQADLILFGTHYLTDFVDEARLTVCGEAHHFVLVSILRKAEELSECRVEQPEGMGEMDAARYVNLIAFTDAPHDAGKITEAVNRHDSGFLKG